MQQSGGQPGSLSIAVVVAIVLPMVMPMLMLSAMPMVIIRRMILNDRSRRDVDRLGSHVDRPGPDIDRTRLHVNRLGFYIHNRRRAVDGDGVA